MVAQRLSPGDPAPGFTLTSHTGETVSLADHSGRRVLVFFYPKAQTSGCTTQACGLRDIADRLGTTAVVGISPDPPERQAAWDARHGFGFPLLCDTDHTVAEAYGVWGPKKLYGREYEGITRSAFLVGPDGRLERVWYRISPKATPERVLEALAELADTAPE